MNTDKNMKVVNFGRKKEILGRGKGADAVKLQNKITKDIIPN